MMDIQGQRVRTRPGRPPCRVRIYPARGPLRACTSALTMAMERPRLGRVVIVRAGEVVRGGGDPCGCPGEEWGRSTALFISRASECVPGQGDHHVECGFIQHVVPSPHPHPPPPLLGTRVRKENIPCL